MSLIRASFLSSLKPVKEIIENLDRLSGNKPVQTSLQEPTGQHTPKPSVSESAPENIRKAPIKTAAPLEKTTPPRQPEMPTDIRDEEDADIAPLPGEETSDLDEETAREIPGAISAQENQDIASVWKKVLETIDAPLASKLENAAIELRGSELQIILNGGHAVFQDTISRNLKAIEQRLAEHAGRKIGISLAVQPKKAIKKKDLKETALKEPVIQEALELFEGRIVDVIPLEESGIKENGGDNV